LFKATEIFRVQYLPNCGTKNINQMFVLKILNIRLFSSIKINTLL